MFDKLLTRAHTQAQNELDEQLCRQRQTIQLSLTALRSLGRIILDDAISDDELRARLFAAVSREELVACVDNIGEWVTGKRSDFFHGIVRRHGMLRKFSPALLDALELTQDTEGEQSACLRALQMLKELNATGRRKLPEDAPTDFLPQRLKPIVINHGEIDRRAWECALLLKLRDELKAGNLSVRYSKRFARLEEFFIDDRRWQSIREDFFRRSGLPSDTKQVQEYLARRLGEAYERFLKTAPSNSYAVVDKDGWRLSVALKRLVGFSAKNRFYRANRDLGRIFKTEFILQYLSEPELRRRIRRGLLKVEQLHALARDVFYGRRGRINARELWEQMNTCSCLNLILACIVYWQACEISRVLSECDPLANGIDLSLLEHVSPIGLCNGYTYTLIFSG